ncbi:hypothetical protein D9M70_389490 [compost metagenome]
MEVAPQRQQRGLLDRGEVGIAGHRQRGGEPEQPVGRRQHVEFGGGQAALVELRADLAQQALGGLRRGVVQRPLRVAGLGHDHHADHARHLDIGEGRMEQRQRPRARHAADLPRMQLEVVACDGAFVALERGRGAFARDLQRFFIGAAEGREQVAHALGVDARQAAAQRGDQPGADIAVRAAAHAVAPRDDIGGPVRVGHRDAAADAVEADLAGGAVEHVVRIVRSRGEEVRHLLPRLQPVAFVDLQRQAAGQHRVLGELEHLVGHAGAAPGDLGIDRLRGDRRDRVGAHRQQPRRALVGAAGQPRAQPVARRGHLAQHRALRAVAGRGAEQHMAAAGQGGGVVAQRVERVPVLAVPVFPRQRRRRRGGQRAVDIERRARVAAGDPYRQVDRHAGEIERGVEAQHQRIAQPHRRPEGEEAGLHLRIGGADVGGLQPLVDLHCVEPGAERDQCLLGLEHHRPLFARHLCRDLRVQRHDQRRLGVGRKHREAQLRARRTGRQQLDAEQLQELQVVQLGHAPQPCDQQVAHPGHQLHHRHAGLVVVDVVPLRRVARDARPCLGHQVGVAPVVDHRVFVPERHDPGPRRRIR